jgi:hypothetical protein
MAMIFRAAWQGLVTRLIQRLGHSMMRGGIVRHHITDKAKRRSLLRPVTEGNELERIVMSRRTKRRKRIRQEQERQKQVWLEHRQAHWEMINAAIADYAAKPDSDDSETVRLRERLGPKPERFGQ